MDPPDLNSNVSSVWGVVKDNESKTKLEDIMSEQLAQELSIHENVHVFDAAVVEDAASDALSNVVVDGSVANNCSSDSDFLIASLLQEQFDEELNDNLLRAEERQFNGESKISVKYTPENFCGDFVSPHESSSLSEDSYIDHVQQLDDKSRLMQPPNKVKFDGCRRKDKQEKATSEQALDQRTRLLIFKMINNGILESINGIISTGKEAIIVHAYGGLGIREGPHHKVGLVPSEVVIKVFKTTLNEFKNRSVYIKDDYRFKGRLNPRKIIRMWAEKEMHNLVKMKTAGIRVPEVVRLKDHVLVMSFVGRDRIPAPTLKAATATDQMSLLELNIAYRETVEMMCSLYQNCQLVHADLSEYNMLWYERHVWLIDVSQSIEPCQPSGLRFLLRDCQRVSDFFSRFGVSDVLSPARLFVKVTRLPIDVGEVSAKEFDVVLESICSYETMREAVDDEPQEQQKNKTLGWTIPGHTTPRVGLKFLRQIPKSSLVLINSETLKSLTN